MRIFSYSKQTRRRGIISTLRISDGSSSSSNVALRSTDCTRSSEHEILLLAGKFSISVSSKNSCARSKRCASISTVEVGVG